MAGKKSGFSAGANKAVGKAFPKLRGVKIRREKKPIVCFVLPVRTLAAFCMALFETLFLSLIALPSSRNNLVSH